MNNGHSTGYFLLERGTRHGDRLSAYLFILALKTVTINPLLKNIIINLLINIKDSLNMWNFRELTLAGKIQISKSLALSKGVYVCTNSSRQF